MSAPPEVPSAVKKNIEIIAEVEQQLLRKRAPMELAGERIARFFGSLSFIVAQLVLTIGWILLNTRGVPDIPRFDPYPFALLSLVVGIEFIFLTTFVLINQKHEIRRNEQWAHLHLQLSMLTEQEVTKNMQMLGAVCRHLGLEKAGGDEELREMTQATSVTAVAGTLEKTREVGEGSAATIASVSEREQELLRQTEGTGSGESSS